MPRWILDRVCSTVVTCVQSVERNRRLSSHIARSDRQFDDRGTIFYLALVALTLLHSAPQKKFLFAGTEASFECRQHNVWIMADSRRLWDRQARLHEPIAYYRIFHGRLTSDCAFDRRTKTASIDYGATCSRLSELRIAIIKYLWRLN